MESLGPTDTELRQHLLSCVAAYRSATRMSEARVGDLAAGDWQFFKRLRDPEKSFTVRKYDEVMAWFAGNWPPRLRWPKAVPRPKLAVAS